VVRPSVVRTALIDETAKGKFLRQPGHLPCSSTKGYSCFHREIQKPLRTSSAKLVLEIIAKPVSLAKDETKSCSGACLAKQLIFCGHANLYYYENYDLDVNGWIPIIVFRKKIVSKVVCSLHASFFMAPPFPKIGTGCDTRLDPMAVRLGMSQHGTMFSS
jgi:hypothetical protein